MYILLFILEIYEGLTPLTGVRVPACFLIDDIIVLISKFCNWYKTSLSHLSFIKCRIETDSMESP